MRNFNSVNLAHFLCTNYAASLQNLQNQSVHLLTFPLTELTTLKPTECQFHWHVLTLCFKEQAQNKTGDDRWTSWSTSSPLSSPPATISSLSEQQSYTSLNLYAQPDIKLFFLFVFVLLSSSVNLIEHISIYRRQVHHSFFLFNMMKYQLERKAERIVVMLWIVVISM